MVNDISQLDGYQLQIEAGNKETEYEPYNEASAEYTSAADGIVSGVMSIYPNMTLIAENDTLINCNYYKVIDKTFAKLTENIKTQLAEEGIW